MSIRGLTLHEPCATLMASSLKTVESRSWSTDHRGWLAIHAAQRVPGPDEIDDWREAVEECSGAGHLRPECLAALRRPIGQFLGCILCAVYLTGCREMLVAPCSREALFGSYGPGRYGWVTDPSMLVVLPEPIRVKGNRQLWHLPKDVSARVLERINMEQGKCKSCGAAILWVDTDRGNVMPIDAQPVPSANIVIEDGIAKVIQTGLFDEAAGGTRYRSHFQSCPDATKHRKRR